MMRRAVCLGALLALATPARAEILVPAGADNVVVIVDPLPHIDRVLSSELLRWALVESADARKAAELIGPVDLSSARRQVRTDADKIPIEIVLAAPSPSWGALDRLIRVGALIVVGDAMKQVPPAVERKQRPRLQKEFLEILRGLRLPPLLVVGRFRDDSFPELLFGAAVDIARELESSGWTVTHDETRVSARARAGDFLDDEMAAAMLVELGALASPRDRGRKPLVAALRQVEGEIALERVGRELRLSLAGWSGRDVPAVAGDGAVVDARWDFRALKVASAAWQPWIDGWLSGPMGEAMRRADVDDSLGTLRALAEQLDAAGERGTLSLRGDGDLVRATLRTSGARRAVPLAATRLMRLVPADAQAVWCSSEAGLGPSLRDALLQFEDRLALRQVGAMFADRQDAADQLEQASRAYYKSFAPFREVLLKKLPAAAPGPAAWLMWSGKPEELRVAFTEDGRRRTVDLSGLTAMEMVALSSVRSVEETRRLLDEMMRHVAGGFTRLAGRELPPGAVFLRAEDLGLGVPTWVFTGDWITPLTGDLAVEVTAGAAVRPHVFSVDGHIALSTSVRASKRLLAAAAGAPALKVPGDDAVSYARFDRGALIAILDAFFSAAGAIAPAPGGEVGAVQLLARSLFSTVDDLRLVQRQEGDQRHTEVELRLGRPR